MKINLEDGFQIRKKDYQQNHMDGKYIKIQFGFHNAFRLASRRWSLIGQSKQDMKTYTESTKCQIWKVPLATLNYG